MTTRGELVVYFYHVGPRDRTRGVRLGIEHLQTAELSHWPKHYHLKTSKFYLPGEVNFTATAEALQSPELCGNKLAEVPALVQKDTVVKPVIVEVCEF